MAVDGAVPLRSLPLLAAVSVPQTVAFHPHRRVRESAALFSRDGP